MARHHTDLVMCRKQIGTIIGLVCDKCDGKCPICDSHVHPEVPVHICDECAFGTNEKRCIVCGQPGRAEAYYCHECVLLEKDRDGCPRIQNLGASKLDLHYERKKYGMKRK